MGIPSEMVDSWRSRTSGIKPIVIIPSPAEERRIQNARDCTQEGVRAGVKAASIAAAVTAVPTYVDSLASKQASPLNRTLLDWQLVGCRMIPWAKANLNYTAQALIISAASIASYFITADKTILECARRNAQYDKKT